MLVKDIIVETGKFYMKHWKSMGAMVVLGSCGIMNAGLRKYKKDRSEEEWRYINSVMDKK